MLKNDDTIDCIEEIRRQPDGTYRRTLTVRETGVVLRDERVPLKVIRYTIAIPAEELRQKEVKSGKE